MRYILIQEEEDNGNQLKYEFREEGLPEVLTRILYFLRGSSFVIDKHATLEIINEPIIDRLPESNSRNKNKKNGKKRS